MTRLLSIEIKKAVWSRTVLVLVGLYLFAVALVLLNGRDLLTSSSFSSGDMQQMNLGALPIFDFPDIWQNITYLGSFFKLILALVVIMSVSSEFSYGTLRQHVIDGMDRGAFVLSKLWLVVLLAALSTLWIFLVGLLIGMQGTEGVVLEAVFSRIDFVLAYFVEHLCYFIYALFLALLVRRAAFALILLLLYDFIFEPVLSWVLPDWLDDRLPMSSIDALITFPFARYMQLPTQEHIDYTQVLVALMFGLVFLLLSFWLVRRADLR